MKTTMFSQRLDRSTKVLSLACMLLCAEISADFCHAQQVNAKVLTVTTFAGKPGVTGTSNGAGTAAEFNNPDGVALDSGGNAYVADAVNQVIRMITPGGNVTTFAGVIGVIGTNDGPGNVASFCYPSAVAVDSAGNVYVADAGNSTIRKITPQGVVSTFAGQPGVDGHQDGTGQGAQFFEPNGLAVDLSGNIFVADSGNSTIRKVTPSRVVTTIAGKAGIIGSADGIGSAARFYKPYGIAVDQAENCYVADTFNSTFRKITSSGQVTTLAGMAGQTGNTDGPGNLARFYYPDGTVGLDPNGNLYIGDYGNNTIRLISANGYVATIAGVAGKTGTTDGPGTNALFNGPAGLAVNSAGVVFIADANNATIRKGVLNVPYNTSAPQAFTGAPISIGTNTMTLTGTIGPGVLTNIVWFNWGLTPSLGDSTPTQVVGAYPYPVGITAALNNLPASTEVYYALVASNSAGFDQGTNYSASTAPILSPTLTAHLTSLNVDSQWALEQLSAAADAIGTLGTNFNLVESQLNAHAPLDLITFFADQASAVAGIFVNVPLSATLGQTIVETVAPNVADDTVGLISSLSQNEQAGCNPVNIIDVNYINQLLNGTSAQLMAQQSVNHYQNVMVVLYLESQGQTPTIGSLNTTTVSTAMSGIFGSSGLADTASALACNINALESQLAAQTTSLINTPPALSPDVQALWVADLIGKQDVPQVYANLETWTSLLLQEVNSANQNYATSAFIAECLQTFASGLGIVLGPVASEFAGTVDDGVNSYVDNSRLDFFENLVETAFTAQAQTADFSGRIALNQAGVGPEMSSGSVPQTATGQIVSVANYSVGSSLGIGPLSVWDETSSYTGITVENTCSYTVAVTIYVRYYHSEFVAGLGSLSSLPLVAYPVSTTLPPGQTATLKVYYKQAQNGASPDANSQVFFDVIGSTPSGTYAIATGQSTTWQPTQITQQGDDPDTTPTISNPMSSYGTSSLTKQDYTVSNVVANPWNLPVAAVVTQGIPANITVIDNGGATVEGTNLIWTNILMPFTWNSYAVVFGSTAAPGTAVTLPAASVAFTDPVSGATFGATGNVLQFSAVSPVEASGTIPLGLQGIGTPVIITLTNYANAAEEGSAIFSIVNSNGTTIFSETNGFSIGGSSTNSLTVTLPSTILPGLYLAECELSINGGTVQAFAGIYDDVSTSLAFQSGSGNVMLTWSSPGVLQSAPSLANPAWADLTNAVSPFVVAATNAGQFFRVRFPAQQ